jgi:DNA-binding transcriptional ArsR family regulator
MFQQTRAQLRAGQIADAGAIAALASPVRQELLDTLEALGGEATVAELAAQLGRPSDGLYYHIEILRRAGLFVAAPRGRSEAGRNERRYRTPTPPGVELRLVYQARERRNAAAVRGVVGGMLRIARRDFDRALATDPTTEGPRRELWAARGTGWVSEAELAEINRLLVRLTGKLRRPRGGARQRLVSLCFVLAPMTARPTRRPPPRPTAQPATRRRAPASPSRAAKPSPRTRAARSAR